MKLLFNIFKINPLSLLGNYLAPLSDYEIPAIPKKRVPEVEKRETVRADKYGFVGQWVKGKEQAEHYEATNVTIKDPASLHLIDEYDTAYLNEIVPKWKDSEARKHNAEKIKNSWAKLDSAKKISNEMGKGYSERIIDQYVKAFFAADEHRFTEKNSRIRAK